MSIGGLGGFADNLFKNSPLDAAFPKTSPYERVIGLLNATGGSHGIKVSFFDEKDMVTLDGTGGQDLKSQNGRFDGDIIDLSTDKDVGNPCGSWTLTLHNRPIRQKGSYQGKYPIDVFKPMDLVMISGRRDRVAGGLMLGVVGQRPTENEAFAGEYTLPTVTITGFDLGKLLLNAQIYYFRDVPMAGIKEFALRGWSFLTDGSFPAGARSTIAQIVIEQIVYKMTRINYNTKLTDLGNGSTLLSGPVGSILQALAPGQFGPPESLEVGSVPKILGYLLGNTYGQIPALPLFENEQTIWSFLENLAEKPWCEVFVDTMPAEDDTFMKAMVKNLDVGTWSSVETFDGLSKAMLVMRETPFEQDAWDNLPLFTIGSDVVKGGNVGGEPTIYNIFYATPTNYGARDPLTSKAIGGVGVFLEDSCLKYGFRPFNAESKAIHFDNGDIGEVRKVIADLTNKLLRWYGLSDRFLSGSFTVQGNPLYRPGTRLRRIYGHGRGLARDFYLEGVAHSWSAFADWTTTLRVTRGLDSTTPVDRQARFTPVAPEMTPASFITDPTTTRLNA